MDVNGSEVICMLGIAHCQLLSQQSMRQGDFEYSWSVSPPPLQSGKYELTHSSQG